VEGGAERPAWSGWWWPVTPQVRPPYLFDVGGPLAKYDRYVQAHTGENPGTQVWERERYWLANGPSWAGHCNGWAAAALLEPEPVRPITAGGHTFSVGDLKGLLADYHFADSAAWVYGAEAKGIHPLEFHRMLTEWVITSKLGMVVVFLPGRGEESWSYPLYKARIVYAPDAYHVDVTHVKATVWMADNDVPANFVGTKHYGSEQGKLFEYVLFGLREQPESAAWAGVSQREGGFSRPAQIWYPDPLRRNVERPLASPELRYRYIQQILAEGGQHNPAYDPSTEDVQESEEEESSAPAPAG
jgi:hypothetical protein